MTNLPEAGRRGRATSHPAASGESIAVHRRGNIALRSDIVHRLHPSTYHNELPGAVWSTMLEAGRTVRQDEVLDNRIIFSGRETAQLLFSSVMQMKKRRDKGRQAFYDNF